MPKNLSLPSLLRSFLYGSMFLTGICGVAEVICRLVLKLHYPFDFPILNPGAITQDLLGWELHFDHLHHREFFNIADGHRFIYPAPMALPYVFFHPFGRFTRLAFYLVALAIVGTAAVLVARKFEALGLRRRTAVTFLVAVFLLSYPFWFELKQGNMEIVVFTLVALGVWMFVRDHGWCAATCFAIAGSLKFFPFILLGLFLARREVIKPVYTFLLAGVITLFSLWLIFPSISYTWMHLSSAAGDYRKFYLLSYRDDDAFDHSLWAFVKFFFPRDWTMQRLSVLLNAYLVVAPVAGVAAYVFRIRRMPVINQVLCLVVASILFTPVSLDYTLIHLYVPWTLLAILAIQAKAAGRSIQGLAPAFACLTVLCSPISEFIYHGLSVEGQLKTVALLALFVIGLRYPFDEKSFVTDPTGLGNSQPV